MRLFIQIHFWLGLFVAICKAVTASTADYPRTETKSLGGDIVGLIITIAVLAWAGYLLY